MDPMFLPYSQVNGVPQESKLATYMKRQTEGPPVAVIAQNLTKNLSSVSIDPIQASIQATVSLKKVVQTCEFIPRNTNGSPNVPFSSRSSLVESPSTPHTSPPATPAPGPAASQLIVNCSPTPLLDKPATYQENVGGTTYFYQAASGAGVGVGVPADSTSEEPAVVGVEEAPTPGLTMYPGTPSHVTAAKAQLASAEGSFYMADDIRLEMLHKNAVTLTQPDQAAFPDLPNEVDNYHELVPLEPLPTALHKPQMINYHTSTYKATNMKTGLRYCLRRIHGYRLNNTKCSVIVDLWKKLVSPNVVQLREVFTTKAFGDQSMVFVYDYHPDSETLLSRHFQGEPLNGYSDHFSSNPNAPRPYSHHKNTLLRHQQQHGSLLAESVLWGYVIQLTGALRAIHAAGLACRTLGPSKVLLTGRNRLRVSFCAVADVLTFDVNTANNHALINHHQQEDMTALGKLLLALACRSLMAVQRENITTSLELMSRSYSQDLRHLIIFLLSPSTRRSVVDLMPMIGARYYTYLDSIQLQSDVLEHELAKEMENGRLCRLLVKLNTINERPELSLDPTWAETGDRYMLKLFRDYVFHQVAEDGRPWLDMAHVVHCLNKLESGSPEKICLMSRDEQSILVVTYAELRHCFEQSFNEITSLATTSKPA